MCWLSGRPEGNESLLYLDRGGVMAERKGWRIEMEEDELEERKGRREEGRRE